jgi:tetratricopeptide (TPR) repeat protein
VIRFDETRRAELAPRAHADIVQARGERPELLEVDVADAFCTYYVDWKIPEALAIVESVLARDPNHPDALMLQAWLLRRHGRFEEGLESLQRRLELDPNNPVSIGSLSEHMFFMHLFRDQIELVDAGLERLQGEQPVFVWDRVMAEYEMTGDRERALAVLERLRDRAPAETVEEIHDYVVSLGAGPTAAGLAEAAARSGEWSNWVVGRVTYPVALDLAMDADYLGDVPQRDRLLAQAADMLATQEPAQRIKPGALLFHARLLALKGDHAAAIAQVEQVLSESRDIPDPFDRVSLEWLATYVLARAGAGTRAVELLEAIHAVPYRGLSDTRIRDDVYLRPLLGDEPRYQALIAAIEANFDAGKASLAAPR